MVTIAVVAAAIAACGSLPPGAERARALLNRGEFDAADREADRELARFPKHPTLWGVKVRAAMGRGDNAAAAEHYQSWVAIRGADDPTLLRSMAMTVLWQGLRTPSATINTRVIQVIERLELEPFAKAVGERVLHDDDLVAAAAAAAVLRAHPAAPRVATDLLRSDIPRARAIVVASIGKKIGKRARNDLLPMLKDSDPGVRRAAVAAIGRMRVADDRAALLAIAAGDSDGPVRAAALTALGHESLRNAEVLAAARAALADDYLGAKLAALAIVADAGDLDELRALAEGADLFVALRAARALRKRGQPPMTELVDRALAAEAWPLRVAAVGAVADILPKDQALDRIGRRAVDSRVEVRLAAARALLGFRLDQRARPIFAGALDDSRDGPRLQGASGLARLGDKRGLETLAQLAVAPSPTTRAAAVRAHVQAGRPSRGLVSALGDETAEVRIEAAESILLLVHE